MKNINNMNLEELFELLNSDTLYQKYSDEIDFKIFSLSDEDKISLLEEAPKYVEEEFDVIALIKSLSDKNQIKLIKESDFYKELSDEDKNYLISELSIENILHIFNDENFINSNKIYAHNILLKTSETKRKDLLMGNKLQIEPYYLKFLIESLKYKDLVEVLKSKNIKLDSFRIDVTKYIDLLNDKDLELIANKISLNPISLKNDNKLEEIHEKFNEIGIEDEIHSSAVNFDEYKEAKEWIDNILKNIDKNWKIIEKIAYIDNQIGKSISYCPNFETENFESYKTRNIWKNVSSRYGVCNSISPLAQYMLKQIGVDSELISSKKHQFLLLKDIEIPIENGKIKKGNTLLDTTWNLSDNRYGMKPNYFGKSYEDLRKNDIFKNHDTEVHKNDELEKINTYSIDNESLVQIYKNIGVANKDGKFPFIEYIKNNSVKNIVEMRKNNRNFKEAFEKELTNFKKNYPKFNECQNETIAILKEIIQLYEPYFKFDNIFINRVYDKNDSKKTAVNYIYINLPNGDNSIYLINKNNNDFTKINHEDFEKNYECYKTDLEKSYGIKPWQNLGKEIKEIESKDIREEER